MRPHTHQSRDRPQLTLHFLLYFDKFIWRLIRLLFQLSKENRLLVIFEVYTGQQRSAPKTCLAALPFRPP